MNLFRRSIGKVVLVADIQDGSVGVAIILMQERPTILMTDRAFLPLTEATNQSPKIATMLGEIVEKMLAAYSVDAGKKYGPPQSIYAIFHSPWTHMRTVQVEDVYDASRTITKEHIGSLVKKALATPSKLNASSILSAGVLHVYVNGYSTKNPVGKKGSKVGVIAFESDIDPDVRQKVSDALQRSLPGRTVVARSAMQAFLTVLREEFPEVPRYTIIDVGTHSSAAFVIRRENVSEESDVSEGTSSIMQRLSGNRLPEETIPLMRMIASENCTTPACVQLKEGMAKLEPDLVKTFADLFSKLALERRLPNTAILFVRDEFSEWLQRFFSRIDFSQFTATTQPLTIETITSQKLGHAVEWGTSRPDISIGVAAAYVNILEQAA